MTNTQIWMNCTLEKGALNGPCELPLTDNDGEVAHSGVILINRGDPGAPVLPHDARHASTTCKENEITMVTL